MAAYEELSETQQFACRVIADHARATAFAIADGILPGNEGRNYVLRKIMRRAIYHGRKHLGQTEPFFYKVCDAVVEKMHGAFPELETQRDFIAKMVTLEEERFGTTMVVGLGKLNELGVTAATAKDDELFASIARLYDTFGTPRDLIRVFLEQQELAFEEDDFNERFDNALQELQKQSGIGKTERKSEVSPVYAEVLAKVGKNVFHGYETTEVADAKVVAILDGDTQRDSLSEGEQGSVALDNTPFYAESGGQVGDVGVMTDAGGSLRLAVTDTYSPVAGLIIHKVAVKRGAVKVGDTVSAFVDAAKRDAARRNHTATHLLHAALKEVLGSHVKQAGSVVAPNYLRFDFAHYQPMRADEIAEVEDLVNRYILQNEPVTTDLMKIEDAMRSGAVAMFGEKYGAEVRVLSVGNGEFSRELCGGTHVRATGDIGSFKILSDEAIASGVRRIRAITGFDAFHRFREDERLIDASLGVLKTQRDNLAHAIERLQDDLKKSRKEIDDLRLKIATGAGSNGDAGDESREVAGIKVLAKIVEDIDANGTRQLSDTLLARLKSGVVILGRRDEAKAGLIVRVSSDLTEKIKAGDIIREIAPVLGGKGGGKPDMAEGGGPDAAKLDDAVASAFEFIQAKLSS
ncbi:MAG: alanine--tRNA ligase [Acidobacteria bacterium]|nr:alanine--tRNA ligase [Acidobacteriota bacterium]